MRFDDRLQTVLNQPAEDRHDAAVRWRQLVDLVARSGVSSASPTASEALQAIRDDATRVDPQLRAAAARAVAALPLPFELVEYFASDSLAVSAPILAAASLDVGQWAILRAGVDDETRAFIGALHPEITIEPNALGARAPPSTQGTHDSDDDYVPPSLHDVVERIEERRRLRAGQPSSTSVRSSAPQEAPALFRWECGPTGEIAWVEGAPRGSLIGRSIVRPTKSDSDRIDPEVIRAFNVRAPFRDGELTVAAAGSVSGEWKISGVPAFDPADGRFAGYRGVALRDTSAPAPAAASAPDLIPDVLADPASLRELVHEIKTPLNAIIGFAEIIEGQYLGPADRGYRNRAGDIVRQARLLLGAIDDLDFAAKLHSVGPGRRECVDLAALVGREAAQLQQLAQNKGLDIHINSTRFDVPARVEPALADRLLFRLFGSLADVAERGETLQLGVELTNDSAQIVISRPVAIRRLSDVELFGSTTSGVQGSFILRLVRGLARIAGGNLIGGRDTLSLVFPRE